MAETISLTGRLADFTSQTISPDTTTLTVKAPAYRPGPGVEITTSAPSAVTLGPGGEVTLNVVAGVGWLHIDGIDFSEQIRFVAAEGMTTLWEAIVNSLPASHIGDYLKLLAEGKAQVDARAQAAVNAAANAIKSRRGRPGTGVNPDTWKSGDKRQGTWDLEQNFAVDQAISAGYTAPLGKTPHYLDHVDDEGGIGGSYQMATTVSSVEGNRIFIRQRPLNQPFQAWREIPIEGSVKSFDVRGQPVGLSNMDPNTWASPDYQGMWQVHSTSIINALRSAGYTTPWGGAAHLLQHVESGSEQAVQIAYILGGRNRVLWRHRRFGQAQFDDWSEMNTGPLEAAYHERMIAFGSSFVEGGSHGALWPESDTWVYKLSQLLGIPITQAGKGGQRADEVVLRAGRKRTWVKIAGDAIPSSGTANITLSWNVETGGNRWFSQEGTILGESVYLEQNGTTGVWTIRRKAAGTAIQAVGWVEWLSVHERENSLLPMIINLGKNDLTSNITGDAGTPAAHVLAAHQQFVDSLPARAQSLLVLGHFPNLDSTEWVRSQTAELNSGLAVLFPRAYVDVLGFMRDLGPEGALAKMGINPTAEDEDLISRGYPPASCFAAGDTGHPTPAFHTAMAGRLSARLRHRGIVLPV